MINELLYDKYLLMMRDVPGNGLMSRDEFETFASAGLEGMRYVEAEHKGKKSFLYYGTWESGGVTHYTVLPFGYYAEDEKGMVRLFQKWTEQAVGKGRYEFSVNLYANDAQCLRAFLMMQFGIMSEVCVKKLDQRDFCCDGFEIRALTKEETVSSWSEIWNATHSIIAQLQAAPVFYPSEEFTEEVYREYFLSEGLELIAAYRDGVLAGIIEWNREENEFMKGKDISVNVGEAFVFPEYRGTGLAEKLLRFAENRAIQEGYLYMWVEHGTANPTARGFWNKYFNTYRYELVRSIDTGFRTC